MRHVEDTARVFAVAGSMLATAFVWAAAQEAAAQLVQRESPPQGRVLSLICGELPEDAAFDVAPFGHSDLDLEMARAFAAELRKLKREVKPGERFEMTLESQITRGVIEGQERSLGRLRIKNRGVEVQFNIWSSTKDSLIVRRRREEARETTYLIVTARLRDRKTGRGLWTGEATGELRGATPRAVGQALMPALVEAFACSLSLDDVPEPRK